MNRPRNVLPSLLPCHDIGQNREAFRRTAAGAALALFVIAFAGCESGGTKDSAPAAADKSAQAPTGLSKAVNLKDLPADAISIEEFFKEKAPAKHLGKVVTWHCVIETVSAFQESLPGFSATGFPVEFEGLKAPAEDKEHLGEYSKRYNAYAQSEIKRVTQTVTFFFGDRESHEKLKNAKGKRATISGIVTPSPINGSADLKSCRVISVDQ